MSNKQFIVSLVVLVPSAFYVTFAPFNPIVAYSIGAVAVSMGVWALWSYKKGKKKEVN